MADEHDKGHRKAPAHIYIRVMKGGPYLVYGNPPLDQEIVIPNENGTPWIYRKGTLKFAGKDPMELCRCGASADKPYCDGSHNCHEWDSSETAKHVTDSEQVDVIEGERLVLHDNGGLCAFARFCEEKGSIWNSVHDASTDDEVESAKREVCHCPSGRLSLWDKKSGKLLEPDFAPSLSIVEDPGIKVSGPIRVKGGIKLISAENEPYEIRNRMTLCRCGKSRNKPFCDGSHANARFNDGLTQIARRPSEDE